MDDEAVDDREFVKDIVVESDGEAVDETESEVEDDTKAVGGPDCDADTLAVELSDVVADALDIADVVIDTVAVSESN